ncbi:phage baseplate assembly protein [Roseomonas sp. USHLN139]|uniref:phage baseplate assembly protein n=1 Tax=Roseomonas sp. USHLN139 TaxID=3081298 RepID=UPI003B019214
MPDDGELTLLVDGRRLSGWQEIRVSRGIERMPSDFSISMTERDPAKLDGVVARAGSPCQVLIGDDVVLTGFVDRYCPEFSPTTHSVTVLGRGRCQDLVDCSAWMRGERNQVLQATTRGLLEMLCAPFGINVTAPDGDGVVIPQFNVILSESPWDIIDRVTKYSAQLAYEGVDGNLILSGVGTDRMASGFRQGVNVEGGNAQFSLDQRFSLYEVVWQSVEILGDIARAAGGGAGYNQRAAVADVTVGADRPGTGRRFRPKIIISDQEQFGLDLAERRANWERNRRNGRARSINLTTDSWRDAAGRLWQPNALVPVDVPALRVEDAEWLIADVTYSRGADGTRAQLSIMPKEAFDPEPIVLQPFDRQVMNDMQRSSIPSGLGEAP